MAFIKQVTTEHEFEIERGEEIESLCVEISGTFSINSVIVTPGYEVEESDLDGELGYVIPDNKEDAALIEAYIKKNFSEILRKLESKI